MMFHGFSHMLSLFIGERCTVEVYQSHLVQVQYESIPGLAFAPAPERANQNSGPHPNGHNMSQRILLIVAIGILVTAQTMGLTSQDLSLIRLTSMVGDSHQAGKHFLHVGWNATRNGHKVSLCFHEFTRSQACVWRRNFGKGCINLRICFNKS